MCSTRNAAENIKYTIDIKDLKDLEKTVVRARLFPNGA